MRKEAEAFQAARDQARANPDCANAKFAAEAAFQRFDEACKRQADAEDFQRFENNGE